MSLFRAEKSTPNANAVRVLIPGTLIAIFLLIAPGITMAMWDLWGRERPWIASTLTVIEDKDEGVGVRDEIIANVYTVGERRVWTENSAGFRLCASSREDSWVGGRYVRMWDWYAFFDGACPVPSRPFRVCTTFAVHSPRGIEDTTGPFCSVITTATQETEQ